VIADAGLARTLARRNVRTLTGMEVDDAAPELTASLEPAAALQDFMPGIERRARFAQTDVTAEQARVEQLPHTYDVVVTRAVAPLIQLKQWLRGRLDAKSKKQTRGLIALKGGNLTEEVIEAEVKARLIPIATLFEGEYFETKSVVWVKSL
jgi:hypothetical protein